MTDTTELDPARPRNNGGGRKSSVLHLMPNVREAIDRAIREERATIDEIVAMVNELGGTVSRSAMGRYSLNARLRMEEFSKAREIAKVRIGRLDAEQGGDVGRLVTEMLRTVAWQQVGAMADEASPGTINDTMMLARAIKDLASADKLTSERDARIRREAREEAAETAAKSVRKAGMSAATAAEIRREILGLVA